MCSGKIRKKIHKIIVMQKPTSFPMVRKSQGPQRSETTGNPDQDRRLHIQTCLGLETYLETYNTDRYAYMYVSLIQCCLHPSYSHRQSTGDQRQRFLIKVGGNRGKSTQPTIIVKRFEHGPIKNIGRERVVSSRRRGDTMKSAETFTGWFLYISLDSYAFTDILPMVQALNMRIESARPLWPWLPQNFKANQRVITTNSEGHHKHWLR